MGYTPIDFQKAVIRKEKQAIKELFIDIEENEANILLNNIASKRLQSKIESNKEQIEKSKEAIKTCQLRIIELTEEGENK